MRQYLYSVAMEAIHFQGDAFFHDLTEAVSDLQGHLLSARDDEYCRSDKALRVAEVIKKHTGIPYRIVFNSQYVGPETSTPLFGNNHVLSEDKNESFFKYHQYGESMARAWMNKTEADFLLGTVNMHNASVGGVFANTPCIMYMPRPLVQSETVLTAEQAAAVIMHEVGHTYTTYEYLTRGVMSNLALLAAIEAQKAPDEHGKRVLFAKAAQFLGVPAAELVSAAGDIKNSYGLSVIILGQAVRQSRSELGANVFDRTGAEFLADQFVARCGAARQLVEANERMKDMERILVRNGDFALRAQYAVHNLFHAFKDSIGGVVHLLKLMSTLAFFEEYEIPTHNTYRGRYQRLAQELAQKARLSKLTKLEKAQLVQDYETVVAIAGKYTDDDLTLLGKIAYVLNPRFRKNRDEHQLQKDLEELASSRLYISAAKFGTV